MKTIRKMIFWSAAIWSCSLIYSDMISKTAAGNEPDNRVPEGRVLFETMVSRFQAVHDYTCILVKQERIGERWNLQKMKLWFRKPMDIKLIWLEPFPGQQALYRQGFNENRIRARRSGILGLIPINVDPLGKRALENNRYPITHAGIGTVLTETAHDIDRGQCEILNLGETQEEGRVCSRLRFCSHGPAGFHRSKIVEFWMDKQLQLPIRLQVHDYENGFVVDYFITRLEVNIGLTDKDFEI
jgi:hypothetical protein